MTVVTFASEAMLAAGLADATGFGSGIGTVEETHHVMQTIHHRNISFQKDSYKPFAVPSTNRPCTQSEIPYSSPRMDWLTVANDHSHTNIGTKVKQGSKHCIRVKYFIVKDHLIPG